MKKSAVIYDKWLSSLGGGEMVACTMASVLHKNGYEVTLISGKHTPIYLIKKILDVDLKEIKFMEIWNDEPSLKQATENADLFINMSFMDYSFGYGKKNIYYTHFPTEPYNNLSGFIFNQFILPFASKLIKPIEFISEPATMSIKDGRLGYILNDKTRIAFSFLNINREYLLKFSFYTEEFKKSTLEKMSFSLDQAHIIKQLVFVDHAHNVVKFELTIKPKKNTFYLCIKNENDSEDRVYLFNPKILPLILPEFIYKSLYERFNNRLRAGVFVNVYERLKSYSILITHSNFVNRFIVKYWKMKAQLLYPPVEMLFKKYKINAAKKSNWICSVGRFFTLAHGKRQEVMIHGFKKLYDEGAKDWQLHLIGGVGQEPSSIAFVKKLKQLAKGYPIFFHFNASRKDVVRILLNSKIYWHATGFKEDEENKPVKFEHFGIAPVEAISAGCTPILYNGGGLKEIISLLNLPSKPYLYNSLDELVEYTMMVINNKKTIINQAFLNKLDMLFSKKAFEKKFLSIIQSL